MTARIRNNQLKGLLFMILFIVLIKQTMVAEAQSSLKNSYKGFTVNYGTRPSGIARNIPALNGSDLIHSEAQVGLVFGHRFVRSKIILGYYSFSKNTPAAVDLTCEPLQL